MRGNYQSLGDDDHQDQVEFSRPSLGRSLSNPSSTQRRNISKGPRSLFASEQVVQPHPPRHRKISESMKTGSQIKKSAARAKGGEFQAKREKKRVYVMSKASVARMKQTRPSSPAPAGGDV